jgi:hypothetical protein
VPACPGRTIARNAVVGLADYADASAAERSKAGRMTTVPRRAIPDKAEVR